MKYVADVEVIVRIDDVEVEVDEFDERALGQEAARKWLESDGAPEDGYVEGGTFIRLVNWNRVD